MRRQANYVQHTFSNILRIQVEFTRRPCGTHLANLDTNLTRCFLVCVLHNQICGSVSWLDVCHTNTASNQFCTQAPAEGVHECFARIVHCQCREQGPGCIRTDVHMVPSSSLQHNGQRCPPM